MQLSSGSTRRPPGTWKGAAFIAATMIDCQAAPIDHLMYYDARPYGMNGMFALPSLEPMRGYYPFYAWSRLVDCGTQVACTVSESRGEKTAAATGVATEARKTARTSSACSRIPSPWWNGDSACRREGCHWPQLALVPNGKIWYNTHILPMVGGMKRTIRGVHSRSKRIDSMQSKGKKNGNAYLRPYGRHAQGPV